MYLYNVKTGTLHIIGYCTHSKGIPDKEHLHFNTQEDAERFAGSTGSKINMCKICKKKRDKVLKGDE